MSYAKMKCPFKKRGIFRKDDCDRDCALRVKSIAYMRETNQKNSGHVCAFAAIASNVSDVTYAAVFVSDTKWEELEES